MTTKTTRQEIINKRVEVILTHMPIDQAILFLSEAKLGMSNYLKRKEDVFKDLTLEEIIAEVKEFEREGR